MNGTVVIDKPPDIPIVPDQDFLPDKRSIVKVDKRPKEKKRKKYLNKRETIIIKQNLTSFSHLLDFAEIEEQAGRISLPKFAEILSAELSKNEKNLSITQNFNQGGGNNPNITSSVYARLKQNMSALFSSNVLPQPGLLLPTNPAILPFSTTNSLVPYVSQPSSSTIDNLKSTLLYYLLQEGIANPLSDIRHCNLIQSAQMLMAALYFRKNISQIVQTIANHDQLTPAAQILTELKQQLVTHLACGTALVAVGDIMIDGSVSDLWLSLGCLGLLVLKSKNRSNITTKVIVSNNKKH